MRIARRAGAALDFGCGVGHLSQALAPHVEEAHGVDVSGAMVERARQFNRFPDQCHYHLNLKPDLSLFPADRFDFVYSNIVLQHIPPRHALAYIREFVRVLRPGGVAVFQVLTPTLARRLFPRRLVDWYRKLKHQGAPMIGMFGIRRGKPARELGEAGGRVLEIRASWRHDLGWRWISLRYCVRK